MDGPAVCRERALGLRRRPGAPDAASWLLSNRMTMKDKEVDKEESKNDKEERNLVEYNVESC